MDLNTVMLYVLLGAIFGIVYSLRRIYVVERKIDDIDRKIARKVIKRK